ncbi:hypothetical protein [Algivirga pacifica]|uniref:Major facilitator superfamily (MFS) profile domain-containing protein n=1 Tax=Algivirga pacifica TaxID=1162670 RepID=A0ABP9DJP6_9BACT
MLQLKDNYTFRFISVGMLSGFSIGNLLSKYIFQVADEFVIRNSVVFVSMVLLSIISLATYYYLEELTEKRLNSKQVWFIASGVSILLFSMYLTTALLKLKG